MNFPPEHEHYDEKLNELVRITCRGATSENGSPAKLKVLELRLELSSGIRWRKFVMDTHGMLNVRRQITLRFGCRPL